MKTIFPTPKYAEKNYIRGKKEKIKPELLKKLKSIIEENKQLEEKEDEYMRMIKPKLAI